MPVGTVYRIKRASSNVQFDDVVRSMFLLLGSSEKSGLIQAGFSAPAVNRQKWPKTEIAFRRRKQTRHLSLPLFVGLPASAINPKSVPIKNRSI